MGYDIHITRRSHWAEDGDDISAEEWLEYVRHDSEFALDPRNGPYHAVGVDDSAICDGWLDWSQGAIFSKYPNAAMVDKMVVIANYFGGIVQGDEGEVYTKGEQFDPGTPGVEADAESPRDTSNDVHIAPWFAAIGVAVFYIMELLEAPRYWKVAAVFATLFVTIAVGFYELRIRRFRSSDAPGGEERRTEFED